jgi:hypothetical protein
MRKTVLVPAVAAIAALTAVPASSAIASGGGTTLHLVATQTSSVNQPHGFSFTEVLRNTNGKKVGNDLGSCVFTSRTTATCEVGIGLDGGVLVGTFAISAPHQQVFHGRIVQGSGAYSGATGHLTAISRGKTTRITLTYHT